MAVLTSWGILFSTVSFAQTKLEVRSGPGEADRVTEFFDRGTELYKQGRWADAEAQFQKAWEFNKTFDVAANLGDCEVEVGHFREAAEHLAYAVRAFPLSGKAALRTRLEQRYAQARKEVSAIKVNVSASGAEVWLDGHAIGVAPFREEVFIDSGAHALEARLDGFDVGRVQVEVAKGSTEEVSITLRKKSTSPPLPPMAHHATGPNKAILAGGGVTASVALVAGVVFTILANGKALDANQKHAAYETSAGLGACVGGVNAVECRQLHGLRQDASIYTNVAGWAFVGAGAVGVGTLLYGLLSPGKSAQQGLIVGPMMGTRGSGVVVSGRW
jgi:tetratricopeptide (TPR) repeat protein